MGIRKEVGEFIALGPLPDVRVDEERIARHQATLLKIKKPVTDEEAAVLIGAFGPDDCFGLAWTLLHLIESAPSGVPVHSQPADSENQWIRRLWERSHR